jgi:hypothetical protein
MDVRYSTQQILHLRKLTRALADAVRGQLKDHLAALTPVFRPHRVLGDYVQGVKEGLRGPEQALQELRSIYSAAASVKPFHLLNLNELRPPIELANTTLEFTPVEYTHQAKTDSQSKTVLVTAPFRWVLSYSGFGPGRLKQLLASRDRKNEDLHQFVLHYAVLHLVVSRQPGIGRLLEALRFPLSSGKLPEFGALPIVFLSSCISTVVPPDEVVIESTEISGQGVFEEVVDMEALRDLRDPVREKLLEIAGSISAGTSEK